MHLLLIPGDKNMDAELIEAKTNKKIVYKISIQYESKYVASMKPVQCMRLMKFPIIYPKTRARFRLLFNPYKECKYTHTFTL